MDFSRRSQQTRTQDLREPASAEFPVQAPGQNHAQPGFFETLFQSADISQEIVVLNTEKGFVPNTIRVRKGLNYQIHIVNVNEKEKNVSFVLDSFSEHQRHLLRKNQKLRDPATKRRRVPLRQSETSAQGKLVVSPTASADGRVPASE